MSDRLFNKQYRVPSVRYKGWNYGWSGYYFVTICTEGKICYFGKITNNQIILSEIGRMAKDEWLKTQKVRSYVRLDEFIVMPNHVHGIVVIDWDGANVETQSIASLQQKGEYLNKFSPQSKNLASIIRGFKSAVKKYAVMNNIDFTWQSRFYDHIIRNDRSLEKIRDYIRKNLYKWVDDEYFV